MITNWNLCNNNLPTFSSKRYETFLVTKKVFSPCDKDHVGHYFKIVDTEQYDFLCNRWLITGNVEVIAWCNLPEPYEENIF